VKSAIRTQASCEGLPTKGYCAAKEVTSDGVRHAATSSQASLLAPIPVAGPEFRFYITHLFVVEGNAYGMYLFGYGNYVSTTGDLGFSLA
jgi:hypothetical protein